MTTPEGGDENLDGGMCRDERLPVAALINAPVDCATLDSASPIPWHLSWSCLSRSVIAADQKVTVNNTK